MDVFENFPVMPEDSLANGLAGLGQVRADDSCVEDTAESAAYSASLNPQTTFTTLTSQNVLTHLNSLTPIDLRILSIKSLLL